jgi:hypothetical protein
VATGWLMGAEHTETKACYTSFALD